MSAPSDTAVLQLRDAGLRYADRVLWSNLELDLRAGEFLAVLGANGSGKTSLVRAILGLQRLTSGTVRVAGREPRHGSDAIGYVQQQRRLDPLMPLRARDVVRQGIDGNRWGPGWRDPSRRDRVVAALRAVDAAEFAERPIGVLSGGEQQRVRIAQALVSDPALLLCDEPLLSLDLASQQRVVDLIDRRRRDHGTAVVFVSHEINAIAAHVDRVLYLADGRFRIGSVDEVFTSATLSELYGVPIEVVRAAGRILVAGMPDHVAETGHHEHPDGEYR